VNCIQSPDLVSHLSQASGAQIMYKIDSNTLEIIGSKDQIHKIVQIIRGLPLSQVSIVEISIRVTNQFFL
jgi:YbbR domain-containing protein